MLRIALILSAVILATSAFTATAGARTTWIAKGAGFGHGVGMSAYGAYGFAVHGYSYRRILGHYFPGTEISTLREPRRVRVLLRVVAGDVPFTGAKTACGRELRERASYRARLRSGRLRLLSSSGRTLARCGAKLTAAGGSTVRVTGASYRGAISVRRASANSLNVINELDLEDYVRGTLPGELFPSWPTETFRAFALAMRSIALTTNVHGNGFELYPDTRTQVYRGFDAETPRMNAAVASTAGKVVTYGGRIAQTTYFSASGGRTESGFPGAPRVPYLRSVEDPYDSYSPLHRWTLRFTQAEMNSRLRTLLRGSLRRIVVTRRGDSPRIVEARLVGTRGTTIVTGSQLRWALGLYDTWVTFKRVRSP